jgi:hypothetical protein
MVFLNRSNFLKAQGQFSMSLPQSKVLNPSNRSHPFGSLILIFENGHGPKGT